MLQKNHLGCVVIIVGDHQQSYAPCERRQLDCCMTYPSHRSRCFVTSPCMLGLHRCTQICILVSVVSEKCSAQTAQVFLLPRSPIAHAVSFQSRIVVQNDVEKLSAQSEPIEIPKSVEMQVTITPKYNASDELEIKQTLRVTLETILAT